MAGKRKSKDPALLAALALIAKAKAADLPSIVTRGRIDENGGQVFRPDGTQEIGVIANGKWRPLTAIERAILDRINKLRNSTDAGGGPGEED